MNNSKNKRLAIVTTHPIQYYAPLFKLLTERGLITAKVFYTWSQSEQGAKYDPGFGKSIEWSGSLCRISMYDCRQQYILILTDRKSVV